MAFVKETVTEILTVSFRSNVSNEAEVVWKVFQVALAKDSQEMITVMIPMIGRCYERCRMKMHTAT